MPKSNTTGAVQRHQYSAAQTVVGFDYTTIDPALADEARALAGRIRGWMRSVTADIGRELIAIKEKMPHGAFGAWLGAEFQMSERTAQNYMNATKFLEGKSEKFSLLPPSAIYALASAPLDVAAEVEAEVERGVVPKVADIRERIAGVTKAQRAAAMAKSADEIKQERDNEKRRRAAEVARLAKIKQEQEESDARRDEQALKVATFLVSKVGGEGVAGLIKMLGETDWYRVERQFRKHPHSYLSALSAPEIEAKFGSGVGA